MKKVAFFAEIMIADFDGASRTMFQLIDRIDDTEFEYLFVYGHGPQQFRNFKSIKVPSLSIPVNDDYHMAVPQIIKWRLESQLDDFSPDVIHIATPSLMGFFALNYAKKRNIPVITIYHTHFISYISYYLRRFTSLIDPATQWMKRTMVNFYNQCERVYVPTSSISMEISDIGIDPNRLTIWQRGIDTQLFTPKKRDPQHIRSITNNTKPNILFASRLVWEKNIQTLIEVYKMLEKKGMDYNMIIIGDGTAKEEAQKQMKNAFFLGKQSHDVLSKLYASADVFIFTSISETYGNVVIEAMASGLPCVIADGGGSASLVEQGITGYKCKHDCPEQYINYLHKIITEPSTKAQLIEKGLAYTRQLDWEKLSQRYFSDVMNLTADPQGNVAWAN